MSRSNSMGAGVALIVAVGAVRFRDIVDPDHWRTLFRGRGGDLFLIYALYLGALTMTVILVLPFLVSVAVENENVATVMGLGCLAFAAGLVLAAIGIKSRRGTPVWAAALVFVGVALTWFGLERLEIRTLAEDEDIAARSILDARPDLVHQADRDFLTTQDSIIKAGLNRLLTLVKT